jgi:hypothetical protein
MNEAEAQARPNAEAAVGADGGRAEQVRVDRRHLREQAAWHLAAGFVAIGIWTALDSWRIVTGLPLATGLAVLGSVIAGLGLSHLFHEWGHFAGARLGGSISPVKGRPALLMFDFDYQRNSAEQFLASSVAGSAGNWLLVLVVALALPLDSASRAMLLATVSGAAVSVALLEWPVIAHAYRHRDPIAALTHGFGRPGVFGRAIRGGIIAGFALWIVLVV